MDKKQQAELLVLNSEFAAIVAEAQYATGGSKTSNTGGEAVALLFEPAEFYGRAAAGMMGKVTGGTVTATDLARSIRMAAAKIRAGDLSYVLESMVGKAVWLGVLAQSVSDYGSVIHDPRRKVTLGHLVLKIEATATKILASLAAVSCFESNRPR